MKFNWKLFKSTQSVADIETLRAALVRDRDELHAKIQSLWKDKGRVLDADGPEALAQHLENMRKLETELDVMNVGLEQLDTRLIEARQREDAAAIEAAAKRGAVAMRERTENREKVLDLIAQVAAFREKDAELSSEIQQIAGALAKAGRGDLKPVDPLQAVFQAANVAYQHPITRPDFINPLKETAHFELLRKKLESKAKAA